jgi:hypothetical protein
MTGSPFNARDGSMPDFHHENSGKTQGLLQYNSHCCDVLQVQLPGMSMIYSYLNLAGSLIARSCRY